jgi:hypothetical protein
MVATWFCPIFCYVHYEKMRWFVTSLATRFLSYNDNLQLVAIHFNSMYSYMRECYWTNCVTTLASGSRPRQGLARVRAKREPGSHISCSWERRRMWGNEHTLPSELPFWELESRWIFESSESNCRGQNPLDWRVFHIIEKILERKCLKCTHMTHLNIWNTSYGQKKDQKSNWQFDSDH